MTAIRATDPDFRIFRVGFSTLLEFQHEAESLGLAARWTSADALRSQVDEGDVLLQSLMREERGEEVRSYRCLLLFAVAGKRGAGGVSTIDVAPKTFKSMERLDRDPDVRSALVRVFSLTSGGIEMISKL